MNVLKTWTGKSIRYETLDDYWNPHSFKYECSYLRNKIKD